MPAVRSVALYQGGSVIAAVRQVGAVLVMNFLAGHRRVEGADQAHVLGATVQGVLVVVVQGVEGTVGNLVNFTRGEVLDAPVTGNAVNGFQVVLIPESVLGACLDDGFVEGKSHSVLLEQQAAAGPLLVADFTLGTNDVLNFNDFHGRISWLVGQNRVKQLYSINIRHLYSSSGPFLPLLVIPL